MVLQQKTQMPVHFEITASTHDSLQAHIANAGLSLSDFLFKSRLTRSEHISTRQYAGILTPSQVATTITIHGATTNKFPGMKRIRTLKDVEGMLREVGGEYNF